MSKKDKILEVAGTVGKAAARGVVWVGTNLAVAGGGALASLLLAGLVKSKALQTAIFATGMSCSGIAAYFAASAVDNHMIEEYNLDIDGV